MSSGILSLWDPSEDSQQQIIKNTIANSEDKKLVEFLSTLSLEKANIDNQTEMSSIIFSTEKGIIRDCCSITIEKDLKKCFISPIPTDNKRKDIILSATNYALNSLGVQEVFVSSKISAGNERSFLEQNGYEFVGEDQGVVYYLRVNDENKDYRRIAM